MNMNNNIDMIPCVDDVQQTLWKCSAYIKHITKSFLRSTIPINDLTDNVYAETHDVDVGGRAELVLAGVQLAGVTRVVVPGTVKVVRQHVHPVRVPAAGDIVLRDKHV